MFLDPDPKGKDSASRPASPFFASQSPIASPRTQNFRIKRASVQELLPTFESQDQSRSASTGDDGKSTVRLVQDSPVSTPQKGSDGGHAWPRSPDWTPGSPAQSRTSLLASLYQPTSATETGSPAASRVSDQQSTIARAQKLDLPPVITLPTAAYSKPTSDPSNNRRSTSSKYSGSGISSYDTDTNSSSVTDRSSSRAARLSSRSTLNEDDIPDTGNDKEESGPVRNKTPTLETVLETSPERSTRSSVSSGYKDHDSGTTRELNSQSPQRSPIHQRSHSTLPWSEPTQTPTQSQTQYPPQIGLESLPASSLSLPRTLLTGQDSQETLAYDRNDSPETSSPNFIVYFDSNSPRSPESPLHNADSLESIQARLGTPAAFRPTSSGSAQYDSSPIYSPQSPPSQHYRSLSADTPSPLHSPKKRQQEQDKSRPHSMHSSDMMDYEEIDLEPWPRNQFTSHLSTIASESDRAMSPAQFSHFSMGSGVLTIDDAYTLRTSGTLSSFSMNRRASEPLQSPARKPSPQRTQHSDEEVGDMTLGVYRAESAKPEPLFEGRQVTSGGDVRFDGPLPPLPPMPRSCEGMSDENSDRLSALSAPSLKKKRSGYSVRGRSNSTPSRATSRHNSVGSYCESERWSGGSTYFPIWAKNFYGGYAALLSSSKISLTNPPTPRREPQQLALGHVRSMSQWTQGSITSRLGTGYSEIENASPTSSHFLPSIFRPRTRTLGASDNDGRSFKFGSKSHKRKPSQRAPDEPSRPDSMEITSDPRDLLDQNVQDPETLPSGHPRYGTLKDNSSPQDAPPMLPLTRKYSKQRLWDEMSFPRPMTKDRLSDFRFNSEPSPHLSPSKNQQADINKWRSPSFVESLDTLFNSRGNRQILLFALGFLCPLFWLLGALLPLPPRHSRDANEAEKALPNADSEDDLKAALNKHRSGDARLKWGEERIFLKAKWWRTLNRVMCFVGVAIIAAVIALAVIATR